MGPQSRYVTLRDVRLEPGWFWWMHRSADELPMRRAKRTSQAHGTIHSLGTIFCHAGRSSGSTESNARGGDIAAVDPIDRGELSRSARALIGRGGRRCFPGSSARA